MRRALTVAGSLNMDFVVHVDRCPAPGETRLGRDFLMAPGGKGANQACSAGRLARGTVVRMAGCTGYDLFADQLRASLSACGVQTSLLRASRSAATGVALIAVADGGQNSIVVAPGANHRLRPDDMEQLRPAFSESAWVLFQLETPLATVAAGLRLARECGAKTMLDPAPAAQLTPEVMASVDLLTPNETEAYQLLGEEPRPLPEAETGELAERLLALGPRAVVLKLGGRGCYYCGGGEEIAAEAFPVTAIDTTAAGDTFNGALAVALAEGQSMRHALRFANAAAALSVTRAGAQTSIPSRDEVELLLRR